MNIVQRLFTLKYICIMKKITLLLLSLVITTSLLASQNSRVTVFPRTNGGWVMVDEQGDLVGFAEQGDCNSFSQQTKHSFKQMGAELEVTNQACPAKYEAMLAQELLDSVGPLLGDIAFGQGDPYRAQTPVYKGQKCLAGCVAVAVAQIMTYYQHPKECKGSVTYTTETLGLKITKDFSTFKPDWDNILPTYAKGGYTSQQAEAVAELLANVGAAVHMDYNIDGSGTNSDFVISAIYAYFGYDASSDKIDKTNYTNEEWHQIMQDEIDAKRPIYVSSQQQSGSGHAYICDGYKVLKGAEAYPFYHMNWGWEGDSNGWFLITKLQPSSDLNLSYNISIIRNIMPAGTSGIEDVTNQLNNETIYDILGRVVTEMTPGNMYIKGGKKFIAR